MTTNFPNSIPEIYANDKGLGDAYRRGWNHGHGLACHNIPALGSKLRTDYHGHVTVNTENIREVHSELCYAAKSNSRCFSPFEFTAHEFNSAETDENGIHNPDLEGRSNELWKAFEAGSSDAIQADLAEYTNADYGIETTDA